MLVWDLNWAAKLDEMNFGVGIIVNDRASSSQVHHVPSQHKSAGVKSSQMLLEIKYVSQWYILACWI